MEEVKNNPNSLTGQYLSGEKYIPVPPTRREGNGNKLIIKGAGENNLDDLDVEIPLGMFVGVTGVSGSGKSTLVYDILYRKMAMELYRSKTKPGKHDEILGMDYLDKVVDISQAPIGRTPGQHPATYTGVFDGIREVFSKTPEAKSGLQTR